MKLKYSLIDSMSVLSAKEMDLLFYLIRRQDEVSGNVEGVYYRDVMRNTGMCKQSFYNALNGLKEKGFITYERVTDMDYNVRIRGNTWPQKVNAKETYREGYVNLNRKVFHSSEFKKLKAHEKYLALVFLKSTHESCESSMIRIKEKFLETYSDKLHVSCRVIRGYLHSLKDFFSIGIKEGKYYITYLHSKWKERMKDLGSEEDQLFEHLVRKQCWRNKLKNTSLGECEKAIKDVAFLVKQYRDKVAGGTVPTLSLLMSCIDATFEGIRFKERILNPAYVHKLFFDKI